MISDTDGKRSVSSYNMTPSEASKLKQSNSNILVIEEDGYVKGSKVQDKDSLKHYKVKKNQHTKKEVKKSSKNSGTEWNIQLVNATEVPSLQGQKVKVAIIDSGIDYTTDIDIYMRKNFIPGDDNVSIIYEDVPGHGTSVAGIIAAKDNDDGITGINPDVELYSAKVLDYNLTAPISRIVEAIYWAIDQKVNIINISFGTRTDSEALRLAIHDAYSAGLLIIAAAGNHGVIEYPAAYDEVIAVGSVDSKGTHSNKSATGDGLELVAPGEQILSTGAFGGLAVVSGTSMASPHVTAIASVLWQKDLSCSSDFIRMLLDYSANKYGNNLEYGFGLVDLKFALKQYDKLKAIYNDPLISTTLNEEIANGTLQENKGDVISFDDVTYVDGSWTGTGHQTLATNTTLSSSDLPIVKKGAIASDAEVSGMKSYPEFHGYSENATETTGEDICNYYCNYMLSYQYITNIAVAIKNGTTPIVPTNLPSQDKAAIDAILTKQTFGLSHKTWATLLGSTNPTLREQSLFVYGIALHTATDLFAHSTCVAATGNRIKHVYTASSTVSDADNPSYIPDRWLAASETVKKVAIHATMGEPGAIADFLCISNVYDRSFNIIRYRANIQQWDFNTYITYKTFIDLINIDVPNN